MPIYEYHCQGCQKDHEIIQKVNETVLTICPACGGKLEKKLSLSGFQLKGGGWYKDGYASPKPEKSADAPKTGGTAKETSPQTPKEAPKKTSEK